MTFSEPYMFVLAISAVLSIPLVLAIRTLLATKQHVILPILRLRITNGHALIYEPSIPKTNQLHPFKQEDIMVTVEQLMAKSLVNIEAAMSAMEAAKMMKKHQVGSVLVKRDHRIVGIVTEPDIIRKVIGVERIPYYVPVEEIMSSPVIGIDWRRPITEAANMMNQHRTRHLAVFNGGSVVGVLSVRDLLHPVSVDEL